MAGNVVESNEKVSPASHIEEHDVSAQFPSGLKLGMILLSLALGTMLMALDTTVISVAIPKISTEFKALNDVGWYGSAYLITLTSFQPVTGNAYRLFHPKVVYMVFIVIFEVGSIVCAAAPSSVAFIIGRAIAGIGAAGILQGALGIITYISPLDKRPFNMSIVFSVFGISMCAAPIIGGALTDGPGWRWCFWINVPLGAVVFALVFMSLKIQGVEKTMRNLPLWAKLKRMDPLGIILLIASVSCLFFALEFGGDTSPWNSSRVVGLFVGFGLIGIAFGVLQWKVGEDATIPLRFLRQRTVLMGSMFLFCINMSNYIKMYYLPFYFQSVLGDSAIHSGVSYIPLALFEMIGIMLSGALITRVGHYIPFIVGGQIICAIGTGLLTTLDIHTRTAVWAIFLSLVGLGLGMGINAPHTAIQAVFESESDVFIANGVATFFSQLGGSIAVSIGESLFVNGLTSEIPKHTNMISPSEVISAGPLDLSTITPSPTVLQALRESYVLAISHIFIFATAIVCVSIPMALGMEWLNVKTITVEREQRRISEKPSPVAFDLVQSKDSDPGVFDGNAGIASA